MPFQCLWNAFKYQQWTILQNLVPAKPYFVIENPKIEVWLWPYWPYPWLQLGPVIDKQGFLLDAASSLEL